MVQSMTGYGRSEAGKEDCHFIVEIKALNHRYLDIMVRLPRELLSLEEKIKRLLKKRIYRGRIEVYVALETMEGNGKSVIIDEQLALAYLRAFQKLQTALGLAVDDLTVKDIATLPDVLNLSKKVADLELLAPVLENAITKAVDNLLQQRKAEGDRLADDISQRLQKLDEIRKAIQKKCPLVLEEYRLKLQARLEELHHGKEFDRQRFFTEVALYAERCSIDEEIVRLGSHLQTVSQELKKEEAVGRKLDFLMQEMNREVNTIASKSNDLGIANLIIEARSEIEKIREQAQNIE